MKSINIYTVNYPSFEKPIRRAIKYINDEYGINIKLYFLDNRNVTKYSHVDIAIFYGDIEVHAIEKIDADYVIAFTDTPLLPNPSSYGIDIKRQGKWVIYGSSKYVTSLYKSNDYYKDMIQDEVVYKPMWIHHDSEEVKSIVNVAKNTRYSDRQYDYMFLMTNSLRKGSEYIEPILNEADRSNADLRFLVIAPYDVIYKIKMKKYRHIKVDTAESKVIPDDKLIQYYLNSKTILFPSKGEGIGYPPIESNELGCSAITTKGLAMNEFREGEIPIQYVGTERYTIIPERYFIYYYPSVEKMISTVLNRYHPNPEYIADKFGMTNKVFANKLFDILNEYVKI